MFNNTIWPIDRTLSCATTSDKSGPGGDVNEGVIHIPQSSSITGTSPSDCLMSYTAHSLWGPYPSAEKQSIYIIYIYILLQPQPTKLIVNGFDDMLASSGIVYQGYFIRYLSGLGSYFLVWFCFSMSVFSHRYFVLFIWKCFLWANVLHYTRMCLTVFNIEAFFFCLNIKE